MSLKQFIKSFATNVAISFFLASFFIVIVYFLGNEKIEYYTALINTTAVNAFSVDKETEAVYNFEAKRLITYPDYGKKYADLIIPSIDLNLPLFHGDSLKILRKAVGHYAGSYFPGEGGTILLAAHNTAGFFQKLDQIKVGDIITIKASYGTFEYKVDSMKVAKENDEESFPIQKEKELLIMYTCYPINKSVIGRKTERYIVYAYKVGELDE